jgi:hypothetical protein
MMTRMDEKERAALEDGPGIQIEKAIDRHPWLYSETRTEASQWMLDIR